MGKATPPLVRFWRFVDKSDGCWLWTGVTTGSKGRRPSFNPTTSQYGKREYAYRWIYTQLVGPIPDGYEIDHTCKNRMCVRPEHLEPVTPAENQNRERLAVCKNGHEQTDETRSFDRQGRARGCKICKRDSAREYYRNKVRASGRVPNLRV